VKDRKLKYFEIRVEGIVQGVGFRPFIFRLAKKSGLKGFVRNDTEGVLVGISCNKEQVENFIKKIYSDSPPLSLIKNISFKEFSHRSFKDFKVVKSELTLKKDTFIPPDTALCENCRSELFDMDNRRFHYPFTTCTHCGPRFSIITDIPYDREKTAMSPFLLCKDCRTEYEDPFNRRFHTEPTSCPVCGPKYFLKNKKGEIISDKIDEIISKTIEEIKKGSIIAIKGVGGFHLSGDAKSDEVVKKLRKRKKRPFKPFAVMVESKAIAEKIFQLSEKESSLLESKERPIVILKDKTRIMSEDIAPGLTFTGVMLPYSPFQMLLFNKMKKDTILIMTSGNISDEPIIFKEESLFDELGDIADLFITSNRDIIQQSDDSVMFIIKDTPVFIRRSRGFVPVPFFSKKTDKRFFAAGADLKNSFALAKEDKIFLSQYIGDLESPLTEAVFMRSVSHFKKIFDIEPEIYVSDMHPGYFSSKIADRLGKDKKSFKIQHHHAHIASVLEEHSEESHVIGVAFDGTGYGLDGNIWGGEFFVADKFEFKRVGHFSYFKLPGGEAAIKEVWRIGASLMFEAYGKDYNLKNNERNFVLELLKNSINSPLCCSVGRLFDGISSILGISDIISAEAEAAQLLEESALLAKIKRVFPVNIKKTDDKYILNTTDFVLGVTNLINEGLGRSDVSLAFHLSLVRSSVELIEKIREESGINKVALSGGVFQNRLLLSDFIEELEKARFEILLPKNVPFNDGCIALGQIAIAKELIK